MGSKWEIEKFTGSNDFGLWKVKVRAILTQQKCDEALKGMAGMPDNLSDEEKTEMDGKTLSAMILCLADKVLKEVDKEKSAAKFNKIIDDLANIDVKINDEDQAFHLLCALPKSLENLKDALLYCKEGTITLDEVQSALRTKELTKLRDLRVDDSGEGLSVARGGSENDRRWKGKKNWSKYRETCDGGGKFKCHYCQEPGHFKRDCPRRGGNGNSSAQIALVEGGVVHPEDEKDCKVQGESHSGNTGLSLWWRNLGLRWSLLLVGLEEDKQSTIALGYLGDREESDIVRPKKCIAMETLWKKEDDLLLVAARRAVGPARRAMSDHSDWVGSGSYVSCGCASLYIGYEDRNTKYYHSKTIAGRRRNKIISLRNEEGEWVDEQDGLRNMVRTFYTNLSKEDQPIRDPVIFWSTYPMNLEAEHIRLSAPISFVDCKKALFDMGPHKAPGEDGYPAIFFQHCWDIVGESLYKYVNQLWSTNPSLISFINNIMLVLIPKVDKPEFVSQFRPISLCNVTYKIITKVIVNRIKPLLDGIISPYQSSFIPGCTIHHNIIVAQEMVHSMAEMKDQVEGSYWKPMRAEASIKQAHCVMHCLDQFCQASGQKINNQKTQVYFSKNVDQRTKVDILQHTGFTHVNSLGKYLEANIAPGRTTRGKFQHIIDGPDFIGWKGTNTRHFTVQSAYDLQRENVHRIDGDWTMVGNWKGRHRIQTFMWLAAHDRLLTNYRRSRWGGGISPISHICGNEDETIIHTLRDCIYATQIWIKLVAFNHITNFFAFNCKDWFFKNLSNNEYGAQKEGWKSIFMVTCWYMWQRRNKSIFDEDFRRPSNPILVILKMVRDIDSCKHNQLIGRQRKNDTIFVGWKQPLEGWIKLNCDGAYKESLDLAGCRGLLRDSNGQWIHVDTLKRLVLVMLCMLKCGAWRCNLNEATHILIRRIKGLIDFDWQIQFKYTWREGNRSVDWLANHSLVHSSFDVISLETPPRELHSILFDDISGACMPRNVCLVS
ncbi:hypothetical protein TSUD_280950 [Trifolium subterraneum]|uniref:CCHC-type domain-containing protein n=1 Tax=Trifolium subterraneum TaxID=3900 RepID=A0A2Z6PD11_TRISU|nr:hypothetical protein TSUD_280950 [Trifolium subterraneum]